MKAICAGLLLACVGVPAFAGNVSIGFEAVRDYIGLQGPADFVEKGVGIAIDLGYWDDHEPSTPHGHVHLDDFGTGYGRFVELTFLRPANVLSVDIEGLGLSSHFETEDGEMVDFAYDNLRIEGDVAGGGIVSWMASTGTLPGWTTLSLAGMFRGLDRLRIMAVGPSDAETAPYSHWECDAPCGHFNVDNVEIAYVPLPPALPALGAGLGLLALSGRRRRGH